MGLQFYVIVEFLLVQVTAFLIFTLLRLLYYLVPLRRYRDEFSKIIRSCISKNISLLWKVLKGFLKNTQTRSFDPLEIISFQENPGCPTESLLEITFTRDSSRNTTGDHSQTTPSQDDSSSQAEDLSQNLPCHSDSSNASGIQPATPSTSAHSRILRSTNRQLLTDNISLRPQRSGLQRNSK